MSHFLEELNDAQRQAVSHLQGPLMVLAGAGSGKTRVLTYRIAHLIDSGIDPFNVLSLTFTNKAAREMRDRIERLIGAEARNLWMGTFHSVFAKILRYEAKEIGYPNNFTIYDTDDSKSLLKSIVKEMGLNKDHYKPSQLYGRISSMKNSFVSVREYLENPEYRNEDRNTNKPKFGDVYREYVARCFKAGAMDFDDILLKTNQLFTEKPEVLEKYQRKFQFVLVDEYQDTNHVQYLIINKLAQTHHNICVVGDDAQSIYAFRGANIKNILNFEKDYPEYKLYKLEQNYRSTKVIVDASSSVIKNNREQLKKEVWTDNDLGDKIKVFKASSDGDEGRIIAGQIFETKMNEKALNSEFAILYRTNSQSRSFEESLRKLNIAYRIIGGLSFYQRKEIKDLLAYCRLLINPSDEEALKRVINYPTRGIGNTTMEKINLIAKEQDLSLWQVVDAAQTFGFSGAVANKLSQFATMIKSFGTLANTKDAYEVALEIAKASGIMKKLFEDKTVEGVARYDNMQELLAGIKEFVEKEDQEDKSLPAFMQDVALLTDADNQDDSEDKVTLMTIHGAKGLEFPFVYVVGLEENLFPSQLSLQSRADLEEERRLFYVALTRAERKATLSYATQRFRWGQLVYSEPSRFIDELDSTLLDYQVPETNFGTTSSGESGFKLPKPNLTRLSAASQKKPVSNFANFKTSPSSSIEIGQKVEHARFGKGKVLSIEGASGNEKATIEFNDFGQKLILLKFAKLRIIE
ncbi:MAG: UvrD-helicase domain-containing protein [Bacteroidia bacterium]